jgi:hypothetical protein
MLPRPFSSLLLGPERCDAQHGDGDQKNAYVDGPQSFDAQRNSPNPKRSRAFVAKRLPLLLLRLRCGAHSDTAVMSTTVAWRASTDLGDAAGQQCIWGTADCHANVLATAAHNPKQS